jgi:preprotein translocase subunit SecA
MLPKEWEKKHGKVRKGAAQQQEQAGAGHGKDKLPVLKIPNNRPCIRKMLPDSVFSNEAEKWNAIVEEMERLVMKEVPYVKIGNGDCTFIC